MRPSCGARPVRDGNGSLLRADARQPRARVVAIPVLRRGSLRGSTSPVPTSSRASTPRKKKPKGGEDAETAHMRELERKIHGTMPQVAGQLIALLDEDRYEA